MSVMSTGTRTGIVAFLFTDIEGSTRLWEREPERMRPALARHDALAQAAVEGNHGIVVKMAGDGIHAAFDDPLDGLKATLALQQSLANPAATNGISLRVRCGLHVGAVERRDNDFFGGAVNRAARIMAAAHGGQVLLSQAVAKLVEDRLPAGVALRDLGTVRLRDLTGPEHVYQVMHPQLRHDFPALRSLEATPNNLPQQLTSFVGRERELDEIKRLLAETRVLTLLGTGGIGKTRLSLQLAADVMDAYPDGVWWVDLAPIGDPALVPDAVARVWGLIEEAGAPVTETICRHAESHRLLLLLDNCEHLLDACARLVDSLTRAGRNIRILATSREPLRTAGEQTYALPALSLPDPKADLTTFIRADAVRLFVERARLRRPDFTVAAQHASAVAEICARLDGIPLALELAAARVGALAVETIAARLNDRFGLLTHGNRNALPRQQTLRATIDWSYDLLEVTEKTLFTRLAVFASGWTLDAAEAVAAAEELSQGDVLDLLDRLIQKSLVLMDERGNRYGMLETIRDYAGSRLRETGEEGTVRERHHRYFLALAEESEPALRGRIEETKWLLRLEKDHDNLKAAVQWSLEPQGCAENAVRICGALGHFWRVRGHWREGRDWCSSALQRDAGKAPGGVRAKALLTAAVMTSRLGETDRAQALVEEALTLAREVRNRVLEAGALNTLSIIVLDRGNFAEGHALLEQAVAINRELGNHAWETINLGNLGYLYISQRNFAAARPPLERALALSREIGNRTLEAGALSNLGLLAQRRGEYGAARTLASQALAIYRELVAPAEEVEQLQLLADVSVASGDLSTAARYFAEVLETSRELGYRGSIVTCFDGMVALAVKLGAYVEAARLWGAAGALRGITGSRATPAEVEQHGEYRAQCCAAIGEPAYAAAEAAGRAMSSDAAIDTGLNWLAKVAQS